MGEPISEKAARFVLSVRREIDFIDGGESGNEIAAIVARAFDAGFEDGLAAHRLAGY